MFACYPRSAVCKNAWAKLDESPHEKTDCQQPRWTNTWLLFQSIVFGVVYYMEIDNYYTTYDLAI